MNRLKLPELSLWSTISRMIAALILLSCCYLLFIQQDRAQALGPIQFKVTDSVYAPIPNAQVLMSSGTTEYLLRTNASGVAAYNYSYISPGNYTVSAVTYGYQAGSVNIYLDNNSSANENITLTAPDTSPEVVFPDSNLKRVIGEDLYGIGVYKGEPITQYAMTFLRKINYYNGEFLDPSIVPDPSTLIQSLEGLQYAINLKDIRISNQAIADLSPLSNLPKLNSIQMDNNRITSIPLLPNGITGLYLSNNLITDISNLASLTNLKYVELENNRISDISPLANKAGLTSLNASHNLIASVPVFQTDALGGLRLARNVITDIANLEHASTRLSSLSLLDLSGNQITDVAPLRALPGLFDLNLSGNRISDISAWKNIDPQIVMNWSQLDLSGNQLTNLDGISRINSLSDLYADANRLSAVPSLAGLNSLSSMGLAYNQITDVSNLSTISGLSIIHNLDLSHNRIADVSGFSVLSSVTSLDSINLSYNEISDFGIIHALPIRFSLDLSYNRIQSLAFLDTAPIGTYETLKLSGNPIADLTPLSHQIKLSRLFLDDMMITDLSPLVALAQNGGFSAIGSKMISLYANPFDIASQQANLDALSLRSISILYTNPAAIQASLTSAAAAPETGVPITFSTWAKADPIDSVSSSYTRYLKIEKDGIPVSFDFALVEYGGAYAGYRDGKFIIGKPLDPYVSGTDLFTAGGLTEPVNVTFSQPGSYKVTLMLEGSRFDFTSGEYVSFIAAKSNALLLAIGGNPVLPRLSLIDTDPNVQHIGGSIKWEGLPDETRVNAYKIYYLDGNLQPFAGSLIGEKPKGASYEWPVPAGTALPAEAKYIGIFTDTDTTKPIADIPIYDSTTAELTHMIRYTYFPGMTSAISIRDVLGGIRRVGDLNGNGDVDRQDVQWMLQLIEPVSVKSPAN